MKISQVRNLVFGSKQKGLVGRRSQHDTPSPSQVRLIAFVMSFLCTQDLVCSSLMHNSKVMITNSIKICFHPVKESLQRLLGMKKQQITSRKRNSEDLRGVTAGRILGSLEQTNGNISRILLERQSTYHGASKRCLATVPYQEAQNLQGDGP